MQDIPVVFTGHADERPLPLIVAEKWNFKLDYIIRDETYWYAIVDWVVGLLATNTTNASKRWHDIRVRNHLDGSAWIGTMSYIRKDGREYQAEFATDKGLYLIVYHLRLTKARPLLKEIRDYLSKAGAFVDLVRRKPETVIESGAIDPDKAIDAAIEEYRRRGKDDGWINARLAGKVKRAMFTAALKAAITDMLKSHYAMATNEIYLGLWNRTAELLKTEMHLPENASLRDYQPTMALSYQGIAEEGCARKLGERTELSYEEAAEIVREIAHLIGRQARETSHYFGIDFATGKPLLEG